MPKLPVSVKGFLFVGLLFALLLFVTLPTPNYPKILHIKRRYSLIHSDEYYVIVTGEVSESTVCRYINQLALELKTTTNCDMRRYERPHINEVWCGDSSVGPYLKTADGQKHKVYIIALIDDASR